MLKCARLRCEFRIVREQLFSTAMVVKLELAGIINQIFINVKFHSR